MPVIGQQRWEQIRGAMFELSSRAGDRAVDEQRSRETFERAGLSVESRAAHFTVSWPGIVEWIRLRWLTVASGENRTRVADLIEELGATSEGPIALEERLMLGRTKRTRPT